MSRCCSRIVRSHRRQALAVTLVVAAATLAAGLYRPPVASAAQQPPAAAVRHGEQIFRSYSCGSCHTLAAAQAKGKVGPSFDGSKMSVADLRTIVTRGRGGMPSFEAQLTKQEILDLTQYIVNVRKQAKGKTAPPKPTATTGAAASSPVLTLTVAPRAHHPAQLSLVARLQGSSAREGTSVAFSVASTQFKKPVNVPIGTVKTGADGTARITYAPTWSGKQRFVAKATNPDAEARVATADYRVTTSTPGPLYANANPGRPLASIGAVFLDVILALVALVWLSLIIILALAIVRMPRLASGESK